METPGIRRRGEFLEFTHQGKSGKPQRVLVRISRVECVYEDADDANGTKLLYLIGEVEPFWIRDSATFDEVADAVASKTFAAAFPFDCSFQPKGI